MSQRCRHILESAHFSRRGVIQLGESLPTRPRPQVAAAPAVMAVAMHCMHMASNAEESETPNGSSHRGSIGLICAVPITTALAALLAEGTPTEQLGHRAHVGHAHSLDRNILGSYLAMPTLIL